MLAELVDLNKYQGREFQVTYVTALRLWWWKYRGDKPSPCCRINKLLKGKINAKHLPISPVNSIHLYGRICALPRFIEVSLGGGAQGASIETNYLSSAQNQTIGRFYIGSALNPLWFFVSDDGPAHSTIRVFINGYNLMGTTALYDTSYIQTRAITLRTGIFL